MAGALSAAIDGIWEKSRDSIGARITTLEEAVAVLLMGELDDDLRGRAERDAHKLAGSLGMFGFPTGSEAAREMEQSLGAGAGPELGDAPRLAELVVTLREEFEARTAGRPQEADASTPAGLAVLLVGADAALTERLWKEALGRGLRPQQAATSGDARRLVAVEAPDAVVLDVSFAEEGALDDLGLLEDLSNRDPPVPVIVLAGSEALVDRVEVARRGGRGFVTRTRPARQVIDTVNETIARRDRSNTRILALDDDPAVSDMLQALLTGRELSVHTINDPLRLWDALEEVRPDLLILDLDMPGLDGIDLCRAVRADSRFGQLPVVFLTARTDSASVQRIFEAGADDYVSKPMVGRELITRINNRLERVTLLRQLAERDSLTGAPDRRTSTAILDDLMAMSDRFGQPLSLAVLDLDSFKTLNDRLGHAAGDTALLRLATLLLEAFRAEDVVGRWGGDEFVVGMYGMARDDGVQRLAELLESFRPEEFRGRAGACAHMTFSAGVAEYPADGRDLHELYRTADAAMYAAKAAGGDRVLAAGTEPDDTGPDVVVVEDDEILAGVLVDSLKTRGHRPCWIGDGQEAVAALAGPGPKLRPELVVLDVDLPGLDGLTVLRRLQRDGVLAHTKVIMLTARAGETEVLDALELGAFDHVAKPFSVPVLMQRIRRALNR